MEKQPPRCLTLTQTHCILRIEARQSKIMMHLGKRRIELYQRGYVAPFLRLLPYYTLHTYLGVGI